MAHPREVDRQRREAAARIEAAALALAELHQLDPALVAAISAYHDRDPEIRVIRRQEAVAALLEGLVEAGEPPSAPPPAAPASAMPAVRGPGRPRKTG